MSYNSQALTAYQETNIKTASRGSLIIMLYDEGIKQIKCALEYMSNEKINPSDLEQVHQHIVKTQDIITELMASLNMEEGGEISKNLFAIYSFFNQQLFQANIQKDLKPLVTVKDMMEELRSAWQQVVNSSAASSSDSKPMASGVNIAG